LESVQPAMTASGTNMAFKAIIRLFICSRFKDPEQKVRASFGVKP